MLRTGGSHNANLSKRIKSPRTFPIKKKKKLNGQLLDVFEHMEMVLRKKKKTHIGNQTKNKNEEKNLTPRDLIIVHCKVQQ